MSDGTYVNVTFYILGDVIDDQIYDIEYNESASASPHSLKREQVDWSQSRIIFIAPEFTKYQQHAIGFKCSK